LLSFVADELNYQQFYNKVLDASSLLTEVPQLPRKRRRPARFSSDSARMDEPSTTEDFYKQQYFQAIDIVVDAIKRRFQQHAFLMLTQVEKFILEVANRPCDEIPKDVSTFLSVDIDIDSLKREIAMISDYFGSINEQNKVKIKMITRVSTVCDLMNESIAGKTMFPEYDNLLRIYLTIPVTTASAERAFSTLNRLKTCLRCSIGQARLNHCLIAHVYKEELDKIDPVSISSRFVRANARRQAFFGSYS
jgi:hypothetical protein